MTENDVLLTDRESAKLLHISVSTFRRHVTNGSLPKSLKFGSLSRWLQSDLLNVIEKAKTQRQHLSDVA
ncbi:helix-turn-helix transcriptional regulator [Bartonella harrusi]|uniref:DNA-binding protein n=1 Tax=Bartonella harrusi TaxID=2961895 RepID=A0ABY5EUS3_9HYPH|nr:helix-turn-helix domain-containing protein [Bartonella harrusi]UTO27725.1 DNA-binding protein [Bartonella harrusi]